MRVNLRSKLPIQAFSEAEVFLLLRSSQPWAAWLKGFLGFPFPFRLFFENILA